MWKEKKKTQTYFQNRKRLTDIENKLNGHQRGKSELIRRLGLIYIHYL